jgi:nucleoside-diphosphate-sugar epimerase
LRQEIGTLQISEVVLDIPRESSQADMSLFSEMTGWTPKMTLEDGIHQIIEYERQKIQYINNS